MSDAERARLKWVLAAANEAEELRRQDPFEIYPLTIISDRYSGSYSHGRFLAFNLDEDNLPYGINGGDSECMNYWSNPVRVHDLVGKGNTPDEAVKDLHKKILLRGNK